MLVIRNLHIRGIADIESQRPPLHHFKAMLSPINTVSSLVYHLQLSPHNVFYTVLSFK